MKEYEVKITDYALEQMYVPVLTARGNYKKFEKNVINLTKRFEITEDMMYNISRLRRNNRRAKKYSFGE